MYIYSLPLIVNVYGLHSYKMYYILHENVTSFLFPKPSVIHIKHHMVLTIMSSHSLYQNKAHIFLNYCCMGCFCFCHFVSEFWHIIGHKLSNSVEIDHLKDLPHLLYPRSKIPHAKAGTLKS
jgi:hypothetical protein